jgi:D-alanyl-D-alanine carboxypeptidase (penicillin-binding protein 5/6)
MDYSRLTPAEQARAGLFYRKGYHIMKIRPGQRFLALMAAAALALAAALPAGAVYDMPVSLSASDESVYLYNMDTGDVLLDQNSTQPRYIASTTKMMTALLVLESGKDLNTTITIPDRLTQEFADIQQYNGADMKLKIGENIRLIDLLYGLLLPSANDAASTLADYLTDGDIPTFVQQMNARAAALGCTDTNFTCPHGLYDAGNVSTAQDLAKIAAACRANETYMTVANTLEYTVPADNMNPKERVIESSNPVINPASPYYRDSVSGMKTGFTTLAGRCFVTTAEHEGHRYMLVILGAKKEGKNEAAYIYTETDQILDWAFSRYSDRVLLDSAQPAATAPLRGCDEADSVTLYAAEDVVKNAYADAAVSLTTTVNDDIRAPIHKGDVLGSVTVTLDGATVATVDLLADQEYESALLKGGLEVLKLVPVLLLIISALAFFTRKFRRLSSPACAEEAAPSRRRGRRPR